MIRIRQRRIELGLTQAELSERTGINQADISRIESRRMKPYAGQTQRLADVLRLAPDALLEEVAE